MKYELSCFIDGNKCKYDIGNDLGSDAKGDTRDNIGKEVRVRNQEKHSKGENQTNGERGNKEYI